MMFDQRIQRGRFRDRAMHELAGEGADLRCRIRQMLFKKRVERIVWIRAADLPEVQNLERGFAPLMTRFHRTVDAFALAWRA